MRSQAYGTMQNDNESTPLNPKIPGLAPTVAYVRRQPKDYRLGTVLATVFCFFPMGLIAVYFSCQVRKLYMRGDLNRSVTASERTRFILQVTVIFGCMIWFAGIFLIIYFKR